MTSAPASASARAAASGVVPSPSATSSPNVSEAITGRSDAARATSSAISRDGRSENVSSTTTSMPPSSRPSSCSRNAARASASRSRASSGPIGRQRPHRAAHERVAPGHLARLPRELRRAPIEPGRSRRPGRTAQAGTGSPRGSPSRSSSAPASRYSRWVAVTSSGRVAASSSSDARWGTPRLNRSVPIAPSARSGRAARRAAKRSRGVIDEPAATSDHHVVRQVRCQPALRLDLDGIPCAPGVVLELVAPDPPDRRSSGSPGATGRSPTPRRRAASPRLRQLDPRPGLGVEQLEQRRLARCGRASPDSRARAGCPGSARR